MRRLALLTAVSAASGLVLAFPLASSGRDARPAARIHFSFQGYANNVRVRAPLVGPWQLGVARIRGSGVLGGDLTGSFVDTDDPHSSRYQPRWLRAKVIGYRYFQAAHGAFTKLTLTVAITRSSHPADECAPGLTGRLVLYDTAAKLSNGEPGDYVTLGHWSGKCNTHVHGWTNENGGARTSPSFGGPPDGGQWAVVRETAT